MAKVEIADGCLGTESSPGVVVALLDEGRVLTNFVLVHTYVLLNNCMILDPRVSPVITMHVHVIASRVHIYTYSTPPCT